MKHATGKAIPPAIVAPPSCLDRPLVELIRRLVAQIAQFTSFESDLRTVSAEQRTLLKGQLLARDELKPFVRKQQFKADVWQYILGQFWEAIVTRGQRIFQPVRTEGGPRGWNSGCGMEHTRRCGNRQVWVGACS